MKLLEHYENHGIDQETLDSLAQIMNDETRERVHAELAPCEPIDFLRRYCELDPAFGTMTAW